MDAILINEKTDPKLLLQLFRILGIKLNFLVWNLLRYWFEFQIELNY